MTGWQPIETAPRDGTPILAAIPTPAISGQTHWRGVLFWSNGSGGFWLNRDNRVLMPGDPTYWMPLPAGPDEERP